MKSLYLFLFAALLTWVSASAQVTAENAETVSYYIQDLFLGEAMSISNITVNGESGDSVFAQVGSFLNDGGYLPLSSGIVLSTGLVVGEDFGGDPVIFGESTTIFGNNPTWSDITDVDLESISGAPMNDEVSIEFDFIPAFEYLVYDYVFGSEEYPEFVNSSFNDAFGFFVSGPGIEGPYSAPEGFPMGAINSATLPGSSTSVAINTINDGTFSCPGPAPGPCMNCEYYVDNCPIADAALDGMTTQLMVLEVVIPGETYHIKMVIGDAFDTAFDSSVILKEGSFRSMSQPPNPVGTTEIVVEEISVAVNPVNAELILQNIPENINSYSIWDMQGRIAIENTAISSSNERRDVSDLDQGLYLLLLRDNLGKVWTQKLVKE